MNQDKILCAAIWYKDNGIHLHQPINVTRGFIIAGRRHNNCIYTYSTLKGDRAIESVQGFLTISNKFVDRIEAKKLALEAGQLIKISSYKEELYSEDLY